MAADYGEELNRKHRPNEASVYTGKWDGAVPMTEINSIAAHSADEDWPSPPARVQPTTSNIAQPTAAGDFDTSARREPPFASDSIGWSRRPSRYPIPGTSMSMVRLLVVLALSQPSRLFIRLSAKEHFNLVSLARNIESRARSGVRDKRQA